MNQLSVSEQAIVEFYEWEYKGRGYYHFPFCVEIEPPFKPFNRNFYNNYPAGFDDGKNPSYLKQLKSIFTTKETEKAPKEEEFLPKSIEFRPSLITLKVSFFNRQKIDKNVFRELLNMLAISDTQIAFEVIGTNEKIAIQFTCSKKDELRIRSLVTAYYPNIIISEESSFDFPFNERNKIAICDFGLEEEFMRPINSSQDFSLDSLTSVFGVLESLHEGDVVVFQILFKGVRNAWSKNILKSVSDGQGKSFFVDAPEMVQVSKEKVSSPLFAVVFRIATQANKINHTEFLASEMIRNITTISKSEFNRLIPLSNEGYDYDEHVLNLFYRQTNRLGMILNTNELLSFVHYPNESIVSSKLGFNDLKTKLAPNIVVSNKYTLGINSHQQNSLNVGLNDEQRLKHTHIIGVTGVGKSTLIANLFLEDIEKGNGCAVFDPHGDLIDSILNRIPENRKDDVILIDPSDTEFPIGFNLLQGKSEIEKIVLSSDLVSAFKRYATAWGDNMSAVLQNAINTILESSRGGTLIELKRLLIEEHFRNNYLKSVDDASLNYYWKHEYPMVKKGIAPLLTRIDTFLRPKTIRYMFAQREGIDFRECIEQKKIVLIKLSQGLIGEDNSYLLGSLFLAKFNQVAQGRQLLNQLDRHPFYIYLDEFQNLITPSITSILSGARKYGLGLTLAHQELGQIDDNKIINSIISNPYTRICFRLGDNDAKKLESGFEFFEQNDLQNLGTGEAIVRVGSSSNDFNLITKEVSKIIESDSNKIRSFIVRNTRNKYCKERADVEDLLNRQLPKFNVKNDKPIKSKKEITLPIKDEIPVEKTKEGNKVVEISKRVKEELIQQEELSISNRDHSYLQNVIKKLGQDRDYISVIEKETKEGGRIDVTLEKEAIKIAFEISITNTAEYEVKNIKKCLSNGYLPVVLVSKSKNHLNKIERLAEKKLSKNDLQYVLFIQPNEIAELLDGIHVKTETKEEVVKGFRITTEFQSPNSTDPKGIRQHIAKLLFKKK